MSGILVSAADPPRRSDYHAEVVVFEIGSRRGRGGIRRLIPVELVPH